MNNNPLDLQFNMKTIVLSHVYFIMMRTNGKLRLIIVREHEPGQGRTYSMFSTASCEQ